MYPQSLKRFPPVRDAAAVTMETVITINIILISCAPFLSDILCLCRDEEKCMQREVIACVVQCI